MFSMAFQKILNIIIINFIEANPMAQIYYVKTKKYVIYFSADGSVTLSQSHVEDPIQQEVPPQLVLHSGPVVPLQSVLHSSPTVTVEQPVTPKPKERPLGKEEAGARCKPRSFEAG
ncbi:hypothetical protein E2C01_035711 [Portunus trituberculatus]|uniref:Uncharacterized protein n=1 Tax=Portunus trituberculatus TaxID=210409 RepID=A0A5B7F962_PORTR|nr:hypothetical protein [Portunus trituberculatus]